MKLNTIMENRVCEWCGSDKTFINRGYPEWRVVDNKPWCLRCYRHIFTTKVGRKRNSINIPMKKRICQKCGKNNTNPVIKKGKKYQNWKNVKGECWCDRCYQLYIQYYKKLKELGRSVINYKGKTIYLNQDPKNGCCGLCSIKIGDFYVNSRGIKRVLNKTDMHHIKYHNEDPLKDTIEVCPQCHGKLRGKKKKIYKSRKKVTRVALNPVIGRTCLTCNLTKTYVDKRYKERWYKYNDGYICQNCYNRFITNPKFRSIHNKRNILFKGIRVRLSENPRKGKCKLCNKRIGDVYINSHKELAMIKITVLHHLKYHKEDVLKDTIELCQSCHGVITWKERKLILISIV